MPARQWITMHTDSTTLSPQLDQTSLRLREGNYSGNGYGTILSTCDYGGIANLDRVTACRVLTDQCRIRASCLRLEEKF